MYCEFIFKMTKLSYEDWEKDFIKNKCFATEEEIEAMKTKYYSGLNTYNEFKQILKEEYEFYLQSND
jgi:hypothetical protein